MPRATGDTATLPPIVVGTSAAIREVLVLADRAASGHATVLLTGESGTGKDLIARYIHARSSRAARPFVTVNCAVVKDPLLESECFGHIKGSFVGAQRDDSDPRRRGLPSVSNPHIQYSFSGRNERSLGRPVSL